MYAVLDKPVSNVVIPMKSSSCKQVIYIFYIVSITGADVLAPQGARASATVIFTMLKRMNSVPADLELISIHKEKCFVRRAMCKLAIALVCWIRHSHAGSHETTNQPALWHTLVLGDLNAASGCKCMCAKLERHVCRCHSRGYRLWDNEERYSLKVMRLDDILLCCFISPWRLWLIFLCDTDYVEYVDHFLTQGRFYWYKCHTSSTTI